jgi:CelD/BcsL family acetyltransferase involved in cellulose biosynthesis
MGAQEQPAEGAPWAPHHRSERTQAASPRPSPAGSPSAPILHDHLRVEAVTELADLEALSDRWSGLVRSSPQATAYASPAFVLTWYRHFERPGGIYAVTVWHGDELVGLAPFARTRVGYGPADVTLLVSAGTEHGDYGDPLLGPHPEPVAAAIVDHLAALVGRRTVVNARRLRDDGPTLAALERRDDLATAPMGQVAEAAVVRLDQLDDPDAHLRRLAKKHSVPRRLRRLAEAHGEVDYTADAPDLDAALDTMRDMLRRRWGPDAGPWLFHAPRLESFTREVMRALVDTGFGRVAVLRAGERPLAVSTVLEVGDRQVSDNAAFDPDPELSSYGLGQAEMAMMLDHAHGSGAAEVDLRAGDFPYKHRWANATRTTRSVVLSAPGRQGDIVRGVRRGAMSLRARRLARLRRHVPADIGTQGRSWLAVVIIAVGVATGATDPTAVELAA